MTNNSGQGSNAMPPGFTTLGDGWRMPNSPLQPILTMENWTDMARELQEVIWLLEQCGASVKLTEAVTRLARLKDACLNGKGL